MTARRRVVVLGGPGGQVAAVPAWHRYAVRHGGRVVDQDGRVHLVSDARARWVPLFTYDASRASLASAFRAAGRRFTLA